MVSGEHLLRALIPHAVINHDVTAHLGRKGWIEPVLDPLADCDEAQFPLAARRARAGVTVAPWAADSDGFGAARLAALATDLPDAVGRDALAAVAALRTALEEGLGIAAVSAAGDDAATSAVVEGALAWLRSAPVRRPRDLPCLAAERSRFHESPMVESLAALAPCVTRVSFADEIGAECAVDVLRHLPHATEVTASHTFGAKLLAVLSRHIAENDEGVVAVTRRLHRVDIPDFVRLQNTRSTEPLFSGLRALCLTDGATIVRCDTWQWLSRHRNVESLEAVWSDWSNAAPAVSTDPAVVECEDAIVAAFEALGPSLRTLKLNVSSPRIDLATPRILASLWDHCVLLQEVTLRGVFAGFGLFPGLAAMRQLQSLTLADVKGAAMDRVTEELVAFPRALPRLEFFRQHAWDIPLPAAFVAALAAHPRLATWEVSSVRFVGRATHNDATGLPPFRALRVAKLPADGALPVVALAPNLRLLELSGLGDGRSLEGITFKSPHARLVIPRSVTPFSAHIARMPRESGVFALCGVLSGDDHFRESGSPLLAAFPPTLRHIELAPTMAGLRKKHAVPQGNLVDSDELTQLLAAARDSDLESLTLLHPPDIDVAAVFGPGGFRRLRSLTVLGASQAWVDSVPVLRLVSSDSVVDTAIVHRVRAINPWCGQFE